MAESPGETMKKNEQDDRLAKSVIDENTKKLMQEHESELKDIAEELSSQKEELTAAIEELMDRNKSLETALNKLQERSFELDQILYRTSHDLRSPLSSIKGILSLMKLEPQSEMITRFGRYIEQSTVQMDSLLQSLSSLSKAILEDPILTVVNIEKIINEVIEECKVPSFIS